VKKILSIQIILFIILSISCNNSGNIKTTEKNPDQDQLIETIPPVSSSDIIMKRGETVYNEVCLACHQADGSGVPMMFPPITKSDIISGNHVEVIRLVLDGMSGPIEINGEEYNSIMPPQKDNLDDQQISDLLNFLRNSFGNSADAITPEEVAKARR